MVTARRRTLWCATLHPARCQLRALTRTPALERSPTLCTLSAPLRCQCLSVFVSRLYGPARLSAVYGKVFTAWGAGGVLVPWLAGRLFDVTGGYAAALAVSAMASVIAALTALALPSDLVREESGD
jgi:hypothetical protein